jgi:hypothetical protein
MKINPLKIFLGYFFPPILIFTARKQKCIMRKSFFLDPVLGLLLAAMVMVPMGSAAPEIRNVYLPS